MFHRERLDKIISTIKLFPTSFLLPLMIEDSETTLAPLASPVWDTRDRALLEGATTYIYRKTEEGELAAHVFFPEGHATRTKAAPLLVCLHGGMWDRSAPTQFVPHCHHFASRGMVAVSLEYRVFEKNRTGPVDAVEDAREAMRVMRESAGDLGIDPAQVVVMGAASGAYLALWTGLVRKAEKVEGQSFRPDAMVLINPISDTGKKGMASDRFRDMGEAVAMSPLAALPQKGLPPCLILHGLADRVVPPVQSERLQKMYKRKRNVCERMEFGGQDHSFFNFHVNQDSYELVVGAVDQFLTQQGFLEARVDGGVEF